MSDQTPPGYGQPFPPHDGGASDGLSRRSPTLGIVGLALISVNIVAVFLSDLFASTVIVSTGWVSGEPTLSLWSALTFVLVLQVGVKLSFGIVGWILGVIAIITNRGRSFGIAAVILGAVLFAIALNMTFAALLLKSIG